jgi:hypothetical protein
VDYYWFCYICRLLLFDLFNVSRVNPYWNYAGFEILPVVNMMNVISGMWRSLLNVGTDISEECVASIFRVEIISELGAVLAVSNN